MTAAVVHTSLLLALFGGALGLDQVSKAVATQLLADGRVISLFFDCFQLQLVHNSSGFLSVFAPIPGQIRFTLLTWGVGALLLAGGAYLVFARTLPRPKKICLVLILAGGAGNLVDRLINADGGVIDFINVGIGWLRTGIFNFADMYILFGSCWLGALLAVTEEADRR